MFLVENPRPKPIYMSEMYVVLSRRNEMLDFKIIEKALTDHLNVMLKDTNELFVTDIDKDVLWETYLKSFPDGTDPIYRERTVHDCSDCRHFIKSFGGTVSIKGNKITTLWDFADDIIGSGYEPVVNALAEYVRSKIVRDIMTIDSNVFGVRENHEQLDNGEVVTYDHFHVALPIGMVNCRRDTADTVRGRARDLRNVFKRSLDEISEDSVAVVLELIAQNSLYRGEEWRGVLEAFQKYQKTYKGLSETEKELFTWENAGKAGMSVGKIRNHSMGVLLTDISDGMELDEAVLRYEKIVAPSNYKRPKAIFTKKMLEEAEKTIRDLGYMDSLPRRYARIDDITVNNILFANRDTMKQMTGNIFDEMAREVSVPKKFDKVEEISIDDFVANVLPSAASLEVMLENKHQGNMVSLIAPQNRDAPSMFKWNNGFSWAYAGNIADSMKQRVKAAGGDVDGVLRFSIQWNDNGDNNNDFDAHCIEPTGNHIYFGNKARRHRSSGMLDVDIVDPRHQTTDGVAVENITYNSLTKMPHGTYQFFVHNFCHNGGRSGFSAEIEFDGKIYAFAYNKELRQGENVAVANVMFDGENFEIMEKIPSSLATRKLWSLDTNQFHTVSVVMMSPNYWDGQNGQGNRHFFFMLKGCVNPEQPSGFFNEYLKNELVTHKRVFEALSGKMRVDQTEDQLSGVGFSSTQRNELIVRVEGHTKRMLKVVF